MPERSFQIGPVRSAADLEAVVQLFNAYHCEPANETTRWLHPEGCRERQVFLESHESLFAAGKVN
jgi:hypothetical protein